VNNDVARSEATTTQHLLEFLSAHLLDTLVIGMSGNLYVVASSSRPVLSWDQCAKYRIFRGGVEEVVTLQRYQ